MLALMVLTPLPVDWTAKPKELDSVWIRGFPLGGPLEGADGNVRPIFYS